MLSYDLCDTQFTKHKDISTLYLHHLILMDTILQMKNANIKNY